jgi:hypothetical protein
LAVIGFQAGMEAELDVIQGNAASSVAPLLILPSGSVLPSGLPVQAALPWNNGPANVAFSSTTPSFVVTPDQIQSAGGSLVFLPIGPGDLPPPQTPPAPLPNPVQPPLDIGSIFKNPPAPIQGPMASPASATVPIVVSSGPSATVAPPSVALKPDVEGNRGKSQLFDVASSQGPQTVESLVSSPNAVAAVSANRDDNATPPASGVDGLTRETARGESSRQANSGVASDPEEGRSVADGAIAGATAQASDRPAANSPYLHRPVAMAAVALDSVSASEPSVLTRQGARIRAGDAAGNQGAAAVCVPSAAASNPALANSLAVASAKSEEKAGKPLVAETSWHADIVGLAVLAFAGQYAAQRWRFPAPGQPRPIVIRRRTGL